MITELLEERVKHIAEDLYFESQPNDNPGNKTLENRQKELLDLVRMEAINLSDTIIGKDVTLHSVYDAQGEPILNPQEKAVFDFQVAQRVKLADYQNPKPVNGPTGPEDIINPELAENEQ